MKPGFRGCHCDVCKQAKAEYNHKYYEQNCERIAEQALASREQNRESNRKYARQYREHYPERAAQSAAKTRSKHREDRRQRTHEWYENGGSVKLRKWRQGINENLPVTRSHCRWTPEEDATVLRDDLTVLECVVQLQRSYGSVVDRRMKLRGTLKPRPDIPGIRGPWSAADDMTVLRDDLSIVEIARMLDRSYNAVTHRRSRLRGGER